LAISCAVLPARGDLPQELSGLLSFSRIRQGAVANGSGRIDQRS
jgi:hypothetical protein